MSEFRELPSYGVPSLGKAKAITPLRELGQGGAGLIWEEDLEIEVPPLSEHVLFVTVMSRRIHRCRLADEKMPITWLPAFAYGYLPPGCDSGWTSETGEILHLHLPASELKAWDLTIEAQPRILMRCEGYMKPVATSLIRALRDPCAPSAMIEGLSMALFAGMLKTRLPQTASSLSPWQEKRVRERLAECLTEDIRLAALASECRLSPSHFARAFKASTGVPPHRYLIQLRIEKAKELLEHTALPITEIAAQVGYDDPGYFARLFAKEVGVPPSRYRRERQT